MRVTGLTAAFLVARSGALLLRSSDQEVQIAHDGIPHFDDFRKTFGRSYEVGSAEYAMRKSIYEAKALAAIQQNSRQGALWTAGVSLLWDRTEQEFAAMRGWRRSARPGYDRQGSRSKSFLQAKGLKSLPENKTWASLQTFNHTPNQGACGSCWAIAASRVLEASAEIHTSNIRTFSAQQLVSCVPNPEKCGGDGGCRGATVELAYAWVMQHGLANNSEVPYWANESRCSVPQGSSLNLASSHSPITRGSGSTSFGMIGWEKLPENKYEPLMRALVENGPVAVSAAGRQWALYRGGIFDGCPQAVVIDHAVVLIAYGQMFEASTNKTIKFWTIQNSWGEFWGENGNIRLLRQDTEQQYCGINTEPQMGTGCEGGPPNVTVCGMCGILYDSVVPFF